MLAFILLYLLCAGVSVGPAQAGISFYSGEYGGIGGEHFDQSHNQLDGPITALRIRANDKFIVRVVKSTEALSGEKVALLLCDERGGVAVQEGISIQVCYGDSWSSTEGSAVGSLSEVQLFRGEGFVQVLGRVGSHVEYLALRTNLHHIFAFGPNSSSGTTFSAQPLFPSMVLRYISGRSGSLVDAIGFHWEMEQ